MCKLSLLYYPLFLIQDNEGSSASDPQTPVIKAVKLIRASLPSLVVITDVCLCAYTNHGHCGRISPRQQCVSFPFAKQNLRYEHLTLDSHKLKKITKKMNKIENFKPNVFMQLIKVEYSRAIPNAARRWWGLRCFVSPLTA